MRKLLTITILLFFPLYASGEKSDQELVREYRELKTASKNYDVSDIEALTRDIEDKGEKAVTRLIFAHWETRFKFLGYIKQGNEEYFKLGLKLHKHADASWSTDLRMAYPRSWLANPKYVLPLISNQNILLSNNNMCSLPFWSDAETVEDQIKLNAAIIEYSEKALSILEGENRKLNLEFAEYCAPLMKKELENHKKEKEHLTISSKGASRQAASPL